MWGLRLSILAAEAMKRRQFTKTLAAIPLLGVVPFVKAGVEWQKLGPGIARRKSILNLPMATTEVNSPIITRTIDGSTSLYRKVFAEHTASALARQMDDQIMRKLE